ncbi:reverse transcriptase, partial [Rhizoctonia solani AG-3 Rhs1AP]
MERGDRIRLLLEELRAYASAQNVWKTPFEAFWGKKPDGENRSKLDSKTTTALFTGISDYQGKSWRYYKTGANRILHSRNITFLRSHTAAEGAYDEMDWGESVVPPAEGENMTRSGSKSEQRDENARTGGAQRVSSEAKEETKPTSELKDIKSEVKSEQKASDSTSKSTTESKPTHHAAVHQPSSTRSKLAMPSGPRIDTANSIRKINALSSVNTSGVRTRRGNPNMPAISLDKERGGVKITVKDTATTSDELAGYCDDSGSDDSDAYIHGLNAYMQGIDAATHGTDFDDPGAHSNQVGTIGSARSLHSDISTLFSDVPSLVSDTDTSSVVSAPSIPSELAYQLASPTRARIPSYTTTGELEGRFGELQLTSECFPPPAELALESLKDAGLHWALAARLSVPEDNQQLRRRLWDQTRSSGDVRQVPATTGAKGDGMYKARLVAQGFSQQPGVDFGKTFAPVLDVTSAFLHADVEEELYMRPIPYFNDDSGTVLRLKRSLYGLKQAGHSCVYNAL